MRLQYEIDLFESPQHLMELARRSEFSHLKHPTAREIVQLQEAVALQDLDPKKAQPVLPRVPAIALGVITD